MNTFPIKNERFGSAYTHVYSESKISMFDWGKKIYLIYKGSLRAIIPLYVAMATDKRKDTQLRGWDQILGCRIAGEDGNRLLTLSGYNDLHFFLTPKDYERFCKDGSGEYKPHEASLFDMLARHSCGMDGYNCSWWYAPQVWRFDAYKQRPKKTHTAIESLWIDADGEHVNLRMHNDSGDVTYYMNPEACMEANKKSVVEFEEPTVNEHTDIMDTTNGHNADLVRRINVAWNNKKEKFSPILIALYERDLHEIFNSDSFQFDEWTDECVAYRDLENDWDIHAGNYLQHIANDGDLESILHFVRG